MRTTIDLPDDLYRTLKARAALSGVTMRELIRRFIEQGLRQPVVADRSAPGRREPPPVIIPPRGVPIPALSRKELRRIEEEEDEKAHARPSRR
ncbi:MAG: ribbon-helix-helix protein, CopG family [Armatimonadota bacterium]|nr:ribbon-helix-helix protein, CopG family [Armatimonadota bacterium]